MHPVYTTPTLSPQQNEYATKQAMRTKYVYILHVCTLLQNIFVNIEGNTKRVSEACKYLLCVFHFTFIYLLTKLVACAY
jgi:hypothetical protein